MSPELGTVAILAVIGGLWWEIRGLRGSRHEHSNKLTALTTTVANVESDISGLKGDMRQVRDGLIRKGIIDGEERA